MLKNIVCIVCGLLVGFILAVSIITPDKDKYGNYTNALKYWTDNDYFMSNF